MSKQIYNKNYCSLFSVMIEVNKRLYMDENTLEKSEGFEKLKQDIQSLYRLIIKTM